MPAYREEANVAATVDDFLHTMVRAGIPHAVIVVDDGSDDRTGELIDRLAAVYGGRVIAVHHEQNLGYGAAVRTGIDTALRRTGFREILLTDADRQFHAEDLLALRDRKREERADAVIGYRASRADPWRRRLNAKIWTTLCKALLRVPGRDVDCAYKLIDRSLLQDLRLTGEAAAISPEMLCRISGDGARIIEHPVNHYPREHGEQTGARLSVVVKSLVSLAVVYGHMVRDAQRLGWARRLASPKDAPAALVTLAACVASVLAYLYFADHGYLLAYPDANSHLLIARRVVDSPTAGLAQLGGVWLPLPHLLTAPLATWEALYLNGFAGALVSMASYAVAVRCLFLHARSLAGHWAAGLTAAGLFALNPNVLYLQATAMTELLLFACAVAAIHHLHEWCARERLRDLSLASAAVLAATLTRYEGWILCVVALAVVAYAALRRHRRYSHTEGSVLVFGFIAGAGVLGWMAWNLAIFGDALNWKSGEYADSALWVAEGEANVGSLGTAARTYGFAALHNLGIATAALGLAGLVVYAVQRRLRSRWLTPYAMLVFAPFFVWALVTGERPLHVEEVMGGLYNVRFGLIMLIPAAVFAGYLVGVLVKRLPAAGGRAAAGVLAASAVAGATVAVGGAIVLDEAVAFRGSGAEADNAAVAAWLRDHHDGGTTLMMSFENESVTFESQMPTGSLVYEGSYRMWEEALADPSGAGVEWIYMRATPGGEDDVWEALWGTDALEDHYELVYDEGDRLVFRAEDGADA
ncbi:Glycosyltransferase involved in cell wall bisynthesis [Glycomyces harbinensis]|uniref:Glycosyltransferase involved in cell wall bisynthesis n=2 Tax=Glycomyces harbinensis TaxID=58114 RepID=A0A1G7D202_9ACTN|nr:Glycosyltransferase involved in cell wall bisynthesis [Glycomyces harbinensis]